MFRFRLSRLLEYRRQREEALKRALYQNRCRLQAQEARLTILLEDRCALTEELSNSQGTTVQRADIQRWRRRYQDLDSRIVLQQDATEQAARAFAETHHELVVNQQKKKMIEKLRDKAFRAYVDKRQHLDQRFLDEYAVTRSRHGY